MSYFINYSYPCESKTICHSINITLKPGSYLLEVWGASGGAQYYNYVGLGDYSRGIIHLKDFTKAFLFIGGEGVAKETGSGFIDGGFNGGGSGKKAEPHTFVGSGGGGTDILPNNDTLNHRVIVAGGGGSGYHQGHKSGGHGGGINGVNGDDAVYSEITYPGGNGGGYSSPISLFGKGESHPNNEMNAGGGGGVCGWFGGYSGICGASGGGGGSGFVFTSPNDLCYFPSSFLLTKSFTQGGNSVFGNL